MDEAHRAIGGGERQPRGRRRSDRRQRPTGGGNHIHLPEARLQRRDRLGKGEAALFEIGDEINQPLDLLRVVQRDDRRPAAIAGEFQDAAHEIVAHHRIEAAERLVHHQQAWAIGERGDDRRFHPHAARQRFQAAIERHIEQAAEAIGQGVVPGRVERAQIGEQLAGREIVWQFLVFRDVADLRELRRSEFAAVDAQHRRLPAGGAIRFISSFSVVVLPAPLAPMKPQMLPSGTVSDKSRTASIDPNRRVSRSVTITVQLLALGRSRACQWLSDRVEQVVQIAMQTLGFHHQRLDVGPQQRLPLRRLRRPDGAHARADPRMHVEQALGDQGGDDALGRVGIDPQFLAQHPHRRELVARLQASGDDGLGDGVDDLVGDRYARRQGQGERQHRWTITMDSCDSQPVW